MNIIHSNKGYTLIEVMVALVVFAILSTITSSAMYNTYLTQKKITQQSETFLQIGLATTLLERDIKQVVFRPVARENKHLKPAFWGNKYYFEFTRDGMVNPGYIEKKSTLKRLAYICSSGKLIRRSWQHLDIPSSKSFTDKVLLSELSKCSFTFIDNKRQNLSDWLIDEVGSPQQLNLLPIGVEVSLELKHYGKYSRLYIIPEGLYGKN